MTTRQMLALAAVFFLVILLGVAAAAWMLWNGMAAPCPWLTPRLRPSLPLPTC